MKSTIRPLLMEIYNDSQIIPPFIDGLLDKPYFDHICSILHIIKKLCIDRFLTSSDIELYSIQYSMYSNRICDLNDRKYAVNSFKYINSLIDKYIQMAVDDDWFEAAKNLKDFKGLI